MIPIFQSWLDAIFPPLCAVCKEKCDTKLFCPSCWEQCASPDPVAKCPHCFEESEGMCKPCKKTPRLPFSRAAVFESSPPAYYLARKMPDLLPAFAVLQWIQLDWPPIDAVVPMRGAQALALSFAIMIDRPFVPLLKNPEAIEEDQTLLLIDTHSSIQEADDAISRLGEAFPKKGFLLSLFPYGDPDC